jgi:type II secretory pathway pseudopilin PulG
MNNRKAFTLVEVIVILTVMALLAAIAVALALRIFQNTAQNATATEMQSLQNAMIGNLSLLQSNVRSDFGFLGDLGCLPATLNDLLTRGALPAWSFNSAAEIGSGWNGPYITQPTTGQATAGVTIDGWGNSYTYSVSGACPLIGTLTSNGPDGVFSTSDDIIFPIAAAQTTSTVSGYIKDPNGNPVPGSSVTINYPQNGTLITSTTTTDATGRYQFSASIPFGRRSINVSPKLIVTSSRSIPPPVGATDPDCNLGPGNPCSIVEFNLVNFTTTAVTGITSLTANYSHSCCPPPGPWYYRVKWGPTFVFDSITPGQGSGTATTLSPASSVGAASTALSPFVFIISSPQQQLNDILIGNRGEVGTAVRVRLVNFRDDNSGFDSGNPVDMTGIPFTVTFSDGSTVQFTPQ